MLAPCMPWNIRSRLVPQHRLDGQLQDPRDLIRVLVKPERTTNEEVLLRCHPPEFIRRRHTPSRPSGAVTPVQPTPRGSTLRVRRTAAPPPEPCGDISPEHLGRRSRCRPSDRGHQHERPVRSQAKADHRPDVRTAIRTRINDASAVQSSRASRADGANAVDDGAYRVLAHCCVTAANMYPTAMMSTTMSNPPTSRRGAWE